MRIAITSNGPGEFAGWVRPLAHALEAAAPDTEIHFFFVPDDYATGGETAVARDLFPRAVVHSPRETLLAAFSPLRPARVPDRFDVVQYLGGDLMFAARLAVKTRARAAYTYKFSRRAYRKVFSKAFALDERNRAQLEAAGMPPQHVAVVGNLAIDAALAQARDAKPYPGGDPVIFMPGSRRNEIGHILPLFIAAAVRLRKLFPSVPIVFGISPFNGLEQLRRAFESGGDPRFYGARGAVVETPLGPAFAPEGSSAIFPIVFDTMRVAPRARFVVSIPGTKIIELAALGVPALVCTPYNVPEFAAINGPLTFVDRLPVIGTVVKRAVVMSVVRRFKFLAQPNIDLDRMLLPELRGTLTPDWIAQNAAKYMGDPEWHAATARTLRELYAAHRGAADRMAAAILAAE